MDFLGSIAGNPQIDIAARAVAGLHLRRDRHVVVTGGTGALGSAVVAALVDAGAVCHVPYIERREAERFAFRDHARVKLVSNLELTDELQVERLYAPLPDLWASIHIAGGFAMAPIEKTRKAELMQQLDTLCIEPGS